MSDHTEAYTGKWIQTYTGKIIDFEAPRVDQINITDIAHGLSNVCRFSGQSSEFYSVAQHSLFVMSQVKNEFKLQALLHDATEAYMSDVPSPIKHLCPDYKHYELVLWSVIAKKFKISSELDKSVKEADIRMLATERQFVFNDNMLWGPMDDVKPYELKIEPWDQKYAEMLYLEAFYETISNVLI